MKNQRHTQILRLISDYDIETQEDLAQMLVNNGFKITQATVSRDIKELQLVKVATRDGSYKYATVSNPEEASIDTAKFVYLMRETVVKVDLAKNIIVVKTHSGMAQAAAAAIDALDFPGIVGSVGGDDTIIVVARDDNMALKAVELIKGSCKILS